MIKAVLFDIDGTLVLSNDAHARAWVDAYAQLGYEVSFDQVRRRIGMGGDKLMAEIEPQVSEESQDGQEIKQLRLDLLLQKYLLQIQPAPGSRQLVQALQKREMKLMVASSAQQQELTKLLAVARVDDLLTESTTSDDAERSKPDPDIVQVALNKLGMPAEEALMIGDTPYDIEAATKAGVKIIAVRCGGWTDSELSGAAGIYDDPQDILDHLERILALSA